MPINFLDEISRREAELEYREKFKSIYGYYPEDVGMASPEPQTIRSLARTGMINALGGDVSDPSVRRRSAMGASMLDFIPGYGEAADISDAKQSFGQGDILGGALSTLSAGLGVIPVVGDAAATTTRAANKGRKALAQETRKGVKKAKVRDTSGQYVGAPRGVDTPQALGKMRSDYIDLVEAGIPGRDWYKDSSEWINRVAPAGTEQATADILGVTSQGTGVDPNLSFTIKGINQRAAGEPVQTGRFPGSQSPLIEYALSGDRSHLGPKRQPFADNLSMAWTPEGNNVAVHDIWEGRAFGYTHPNGKPWDAGFSPQQHAFMDEQHNVIQDRLNKDQVGGFSDWDALNTQAASWSGAKIKAGDITPETAATHYGDFSPKYQANATYEQTPGAGTGYLEGIVDMPYEQRLAHSNEASWINDKGQDSIYSSGGMLTEPTLSTVGAYTPAGTGKLEINPGNVARPLVTTDKGSVTDTSRQLLDIGESSRAYVDAQNAGAWHKIVPNSQTSAGERSSLTIPMDKSPSPEEMAKITKIAEDNGFFAVDTGNGVNLINDIYSDIGSNRTGTTLGKELKGKLGESLKGIGKPERVKVDTGYQDYEELWAAGPGSGRATEKFLDDLSKNESFAQAIEPALRKKAAQNLARDTEFARVNALPMREDMATALKTLSEGGIKALQKAVKSGVILPAVAFAVLSPSMIEEMRGNQQTEMN